MTAELEVAGVVDQARLAMQRMASSVSVLSCLCQEKKYAMTMTAVNSLSFDPPSMLVCVNRTASAYQALLQSCNFCINVLGAGHEEVSKACSGSLAGEDRFGVGNWAENESGIPYLKDAQANVFMHCDRKWSYGTHGILVGRVFDVRVPGSLNPLVYINRLYHRIPGQAG